ncbi:MAG TPA: hypothetical protein VMT88_08700 [Actinomycetes bacterium]|nr:hypothetical protein [Actinomycetes bacterium]
MTRLSLATENESAGLRQYLERLVALDNRAVVRVQAGGAAMGVWSGPPFEVVALKPVGLNGIGEVDATVPAQRLLERVTTGFEFDLPDTVPGPSWVGLLPPREGWEIRGKSDVANVRAAVDSAKQFFRQRAEGVTDQRLLQDIANDVWERTCLAEVPVRSAHAAESLGLLGPGDGEVVAYATDAWTRLAAPGGSVATRRGLMPSIPFFALN